MIEYRNDRKVKDTIEDIRARGSCQEAIDWWQDREDYTLRGLGNPKSFLTRCEYTILRNPH